MNKKTHKNSFYIEREAYIVTFDQFNVSLMNTSMNLKKIILLNLNF